VAGPALSERSESKGPIDTWHALVGSDAAAMERLCVELAGRMRERRLTFGGRLLCPFLRPFFLEPSDEARVARAAEALWRMGESVARAALEDRSLLDDLGLSEAERRLATIDPGYATISTAARADAFLLPDSLQFAEYNAESPAGAGYSEGLAGVFSDTPVMRRFDDAFEARMYRPVAALLDALVESYREWGGTASPPRIAIVDWREVPTWSEFELLRDAFVARGVPTVVCDPGELTLERGVLRAGGAAVDLVYRRVLINDIVSRSDECRTLVAAYEQRAACVANTLRCKIPHKKAFFAVLTDERRASLFSPDERAIIGSHVPWTVVVRETTVHRDGRALDLVPYLRAHRDRLVIKPNDEYGGSGVTLGWETGEKDWDAAIARALADPAGWVAQERIAVRRETFPVCADGRVEMRDMLVDFAPYIFRGRLAGFLTRLSATGLANVTSGGGQVPAFLVTEKLRRDAQTSEPRSREDAKSKIR
jgi:uncharacterized circularly permuted ATP-grasp superfamily protein